MKILATEAVLKRLGDGAALDQLSADIAKAGMACVDAKKPSSVTLKISFKPVKGSALAVNADCTVDCKIPKRDLEPKTFFATGDGLTLDDPLQDVLRTREGEEV